MGIENLLAQGVQIRPQGMEANALMQYQQFRQQQAQNALMNYQLSQAKRKDAADEQAALQLAQWRNALQMPQGQQELVPGRPAMNAAQAESAAMTPGYGVSSAQDQWKTGAPDPRMVALTGAAKAGLMGPADFLKAAYPEQKIGHAPAGSMIFDERTGRQIAQVPDKAPSDTNDWKDYQRAVSQGFKGQFMDYQERMAKLKSPKTTVEVNTGQKGLDNTMKVREAFRQEPVYKAHQEMQSAYSQIQQSLKQNSPVGDLAGATKIMKLLDPGSVVRESELGMAMAATGLLDRATGLASNIINGTKLTPNQRVQFQELADALFGESVKQYNAKRSEYQGIAERNGLNISDVLGAPTATPPSKPAKTGALTADERAELAKLRERFKGK